jgi:deazaflavin-dependent oxidoreductase (nitroreductase family)
VNDELPDIDPNLPATDPAAMEEFNRRHIVPRFRAKGGKLGGQFEGMPVLLLNTVGARSGAARTVPLAYVEDGDRYVVIASRAGAPTNPAWYHNLLAHPGATVEIGTDRLEVRASVAVGEERDRLFQKVAAQLPMFGVYQQKTRRRIPVVVLERSKDARPASTIADRIEREVLIEAPVEVVWSAVTEPDLIGRWFADAAQVDVRLGGQGTLTWGDRATAQPTVAPITVEAVEPPRRFAFRWGQPEGAGPGEGNSRLVEFTLSPEGARTRVRLVERGWQALALPEERKAREFDIFSRGWDVHLSSLRDFAARRSQTSP